MVEPVVIVHIEMLACYFPFPPQVQKMFNACTYNPKPSSPTILKAVLNIRKPKNPFFMRLWATLYTALEHPEEHMEKFAKVLSKRVAS